MLLSAHFIFLFVVAANDAGYFNAEMAPIEVKTKKGKESLQKDEHPKPQTTMEQLTKLPCVFKKDGTVTAGNASVSTSDPGLARCPLCGSPNLLPLLLSLTKLAVSGVS